MDCLKLRCRGTCNKVKGKCWETALSQEIACRKPTVLDRELASSAFQRLIIKTTKTPIKNTEHFERADDEWREGLTWGWSRGRSVVTAPLITWDQLSLSAVGWAGLLIMVLGVASLSIIIELCPGLIVAIFHCPRGRHAATIRCSAAERARVHNVNARRYMSATKIRDCSKIGKIHKGGHK